MEIQKIHRFDLTPKEAIELQKHLATKVVLKAEKKPYSFVAGADISFSKKDPRIFASVIVMKIPEMEILETVSISDTSSFPYIPGLLAFREIPPLCKAFKLLKIIPDVILCDGQGIAHPRGIGLATHLGILLDLPTVGCAKKRLVGEYITPKINRFSETSLYYKGKTVGAVLRTRSGVKPMFISPGHKMDLATSIEIVKKCVGRYRIPEPTRIAHIIVNKIRREQTIPSFNPYFSQNLG